MEHLSILSTLIFHTAMSDHLFTATAVLFYVSHIDEQYKLIGQGGGGIGLTTCTLFLPCILQQEMFV